MSKLNTTDLVNLQNEVTAVSTINSNFTAVETAIENTLSRDGTTPNTMSANLDMNSNRIINLPLPTSDLEPLRLIDAAGATIPIILTPDGDKGDLTVSGTGTIYTIDDDVVTYAKMQNVSAASKLLGRGDSGSGDTQEITIGTGLAMSGTTLNGTGVTPPGGSDTHIQFNDSSVFGGDAGLTYNKTTNVLTNTAGQVVLAGGTVTTSIPLIDSTQTWNAGGVTFTGLKLNITNTASAVASMFADFQLGGTSYVQVRRDASNGSPGIFFRDVASGNYYGISSLVDTLVLGSPSTIRQASKASDGGLTGTPSTFTLSSENALSWSSVASATNNSDLALYRDAAGVIAQRNGTNAQSLRVYSTFTDTSNFQRLAISGNRIASEKAGAGSDTVTASTPVLDLTQTWNSGGVTFTGLKFNVTNTASATGSLLLDLQVGASSKFAVDKVGQVIGVVGSASVPTYTFAGGTSTGIYTESGLFKVSIGGVEKFALDNSRLYLSGEAIGWGGDTYIFRDAVDILAQRNGTNDQTFRVYNTFVDASNYERGVLDWSTTANTLTIGTQQAGSGTARDVSLRRGGTEFLRLSSSSIFHFSSTDFNSNTLVNLGHTTFGDFYTWAGGKRVTADFSKSLDTTLANVTGLSVNVTAGRTYSFEAILHTTSTTNGGVKFAIAGTATATAIVTEALLYDQANLTEPVQTRAAALGTALVGTTAVTVAYARITGTITVNAGGTLTVQFAQNASHIDTSTVLRGSTFIVQDIV